MFYFHGGGFFGGSKNMGDPMAAGEATALIDDICAQGYNIVNVDYALVPDYLFPVLLIQLNEAIRFIDEHKDEYHINMDNVILMGTIPVITGTALMLPRYFFRHDSCDTASASCQPVVSPLRRPFSNSLRSFSLARSTSYWRY